MDVYRGDIDAEPNFFRYALFVSFFPQLVAGPIERSGKKVRYLNTHRIARLDPKESHTHSFFCLSRARGSGMRFAREMSRPLR